MRILILGGDGMLGHRLLQHFQTDHVVRVTLRRDLAVYRDAGLFDSDNSYAGVDVRSTDRLIEVVADFQPEAVINAVGIVKQRKLVNESIPSLEINALFPHRLAKICKRSEARLVHVSTDCVFSGRKGGYTEQDESDAVDLYGRSKFLGEVHDSHCITFRTSIIGLELSRRTGLIEWYLAQKGAIKGYQGAIFTGLTTIELARVMERVLTRHADLSGVWHVAAQPTSKYDLLCALTEKLQCHDLHIEEDHEFVCDRSLDASRFEAHTGYVAPTWNFMLDELVHCIERRN